MKAILRGIFILSIVSFIFSCRQIPEDEKMDDISGENIAKVIINPVELEWGNQLISANADEQGVSAWGGGGKYLIYSELHPEKQIIKIDGDLYAEIERTPSRGVDLPYGLESGVKKKPGSKYIVEPGQNYSVYAFDSDTGKIRDYNTGVTGKAPPTLVLDGSKSYDLVVILGYNIPSPYKKIDHIDTPLSIFPGCLYWHKSYEAKSGTQELDIVLRQLDLAIEFLIDTSILSIYNGQEVSFKDFKLTGLSVERNLNLRTGKTFLINNKIDYGFKINKISNNLYKNDGHAGYIYPFISENSKTIYLKGTIIAPDMNGINNEKNISMRLDLEPGHIYTYKIKLTGKSYIDRCQDSSADNYGEPLPCRFSPITQIVLEERTRDGGFSSDGIIMAIGPDSGLNQINVCNHIREWKEKDVVQYIDINIDNFNVDLHKVVHTPVSQYNKNVIRSIEYTENNGKKQLVIKFYACVVTYKSEIEEKITVEVISKKDNRILSKAILNLAVKLNK